MTVKGPTTTGPGRDGKPVPPERAIEESGHRVDPRVGEFARLASAVQHERHRIGAADADGITRSSALWSLMQLDVNIKQALQQGGLEQERLAAALSIRNTVSPAEGPVVMNAYLEGAVRAYLANLHTTRPIGLADLALAILRDSRDSGIGLLPQRLGELRVDLHAATAAVELLIPGENAEFSVSVRQARDALGSTTRITAAQLAEALQRGHPEYGDHRFAEVHLRPSIGETASTEDWLEQVASLYDLSEIAATKHDVVDGELTLLGLAELDPPLAKDMRANGFLTILADGVAVRPRHPRADHADWADDAAAVKDRLGRQFFAKALAERLRTLIEPTSTYRRSFLIHLDGPWGAGKSTVLGFLKEELRDKFLIIEINAWREQRIGVQWWTILDSLQRGVTASKGGFRRPMTQLAGLIDRIRAGWLSLAVLLLIAGLIVGAAIAGFDLSTGGAVADNVSKIISLAAAVTAGLLAAGRFMIPSSRRSAEVFVERSANPMQEVERLLGRSLRRAGKPVLFLIDDLDRCDAEYVVEFLEAVQTLLRDAWHSLPEQAHAGPYAFIAADGQWLRTSYEKHYDVFSEASRPGRPLGYLFQEKVFQLHTRLPAITSSARDAFLRGILLPSVDRAAAKPEPVKRAAQNAVNEATSHAEVIDAARKAVNIVDPVARMEVLGQAAVKFSQRDIQKATEHDLARFSQFLEPNPRGIKLFTNTYGVLRSLRTLEEVFIDAGPLALWTVLEVRWPVLADYLREEASELAHASVVNVPGDIEALLRDPDVRAVLDDMTSGPLTAEIIRQCAGTA